jgi:hypothetical protein
MERNPDAGHNHLKTLRFVADCPLCEAEKAVRNRAIEHLSEALHLLEGLRKPGDKPTIRLNLAPIGVTGDDVARCHSIDLSAKQAEALADAIDSMNAHDDTLRAAFQQAQPVIEALIEVDEASVARRGAELIAWMEGQTGEAIDSGEWTADALISTDPELAAEIVDTFLELDPREITKTVLDHRQVDMPRAIEALDDWFGEIADPYADEDDD